MEKEELKRRARQTVCDWLNDTRWLARDHINLHALDREPFFRGEPTRDCAVSSDELRELIVCLDGVIGRLTEEET